jgi:hypothetical protein
MMVKALSLRQPWAWLVSTGVKTIENRKWRTQHRGPFLIHAALAMSWEDYDFARRFCAMDLPPIDSPLYVRGGIVGAADLVDIFPPGSNDGGRWHMKEQYGYLLERISELPFRSLKGALNFFNVEANEVEARAITAMTRDITPPYWELV